MATPLEDQAAYKKRYPRQVSFHCTQAELDYFTAVRDALRHKDPASNFRSVFVLMAKTLISQKLFIPEDFDVNSIL